MKIEPMLTENEVKLQLLFHNKLLNLVGCKARFVLANGTFEGVVRDVVRNPVKFVSQGSNGEKVTQDYYIIAGFILQSEMMVSMALMARMA